jgi:hypothetical protein
MTHAREPRTWTPLGRQRSISQQSNPHAHNQPATRLFSGLLAHVAQVQAGPQKPPFAKQSQYSFRHLDFLQLHFLGLHGLGEAAVYLNCATTSSYGETAMHV